MEMTFNSLSVYRSFYKEDGNCVTASYSAKSGTVDIEFSFEKVKLDDLEKHLDFMRPYVCQNVGFSLNNKVDSNVILEDFDISIHNIITLKFVNRKNPDIHCTISFCVDAFGKDFWKDFRSGNPFELKVFYEN